MQANWLSTENPWVQVKGFQWHMAPAFRKSSFGLLLLISDPLPHSPPTSLTFMLRQGVLHGKEICQGCKALCPSLAVVLHWQRETRGCHPSVLPPASSSTWGCSPLQAVCEVPCVLINQHRQVTKKAVCGRDCTKMTALFGNCNTLRAGVLRRWSGGCISVVVCRMSLPQL